MVEPIPDVELPDLREIASAERPSNGGAGEASSQRAAVVDEHVVLEPTVAKRAPRPFEDDPTVFRVEDGVNFCPRDLLPPGAVYAFAARMTGDPRDPTKQPGISLYCPDKGEYDLVCNLADLAPRTWTRLTDRSGQPVPFELYPLTSSADLYVRWNVPLPSMPASGGGFSRPANWWPPQAAPLTYTPPPLAGAPNPGSSAPESGKSGVPWGKLALLAIGAVVAGRQSSEKDQKKT